MVSAKNSISGTREWAVANIDCCTGCSHGCKYCYARYKSVFKAKEVDLNDWETPRVRQVDVKRAHPLYPGTVMFPTTHDIHPNILEDCITVLKNLIASGNKILIVSKPHPQSIEKICTQFEEYKNLILFRFTITAQDNRILKFWEPGAPSYNERLKSLQYAYKSNFETSVSIEPMLDCDNICNLVAELTPYVSHSIWLGKMNKIEKRVKCDSQEMEKEIERIVTSQSDEKLKKLYKEFRNNSLIRWKESIKDVVGLKRAEEPGLDV